jgi:hypothetical protein
MFADDGFIISWSNRVNDLMTPSSVDGNFRPHAPLFSPSYFGGRAAGAVKQSRILQINDEDTGVPTRLNEIPQPWKHRLAVIIFAEVVLDIDD